MSGIKLGAHKDTRSHAMANAALIEVRDKVAYVTLNRPEKLNAINNDMLGDLFEAFTEIRDLSLIHI